MAEEQPKITLYWLNLSRAQRIVWLLEELKVPYDVELFHRNKKTMLAPPELEKIHPLGKSPVLTILPPGTPEANQLVLAESGLITQYLTEHFPEGQRLTPPRWKPGMENKVGGETEAYMRYQYYLHYSEGSLMPILVFTLVLSKLKSPDVPFYIRPISSAIANRIISSFLLPNAKKHYAMLDSQLETSGGDYLCGDSLTAADILMSFPLIAAKSRLNELGEWAGGSWEAAHPRVKAYVDRLENSDGYKRSVEKVRLMEGSDTLEASL